jgi:hypothetical protein
MTVARGIAAAMAGTSAASGSFSACVSSTGQPMRPTRSRLLNCRVLSRKLLRSDTPFAQKPRFRIDQRSAGLRSISAWALSRTGWLKGWAPLASAALAPNCSITFSSMVPRSHWPGSAMQAAMRASPLAARGAR